MFKNFIISTMVLIILSMSIFCDVSAQSSDDRIGSLAVCVRRACTLSKVSREISGSCWALSQLSSYVSEQIWPV